MACSIEFSDMLASVDASTQAIYVIPDEHRGNLGPFCAEMIQKIFPFFSESDILGDPRDIIRDVSEKLLNELVYAGPRDIHDMYDVDSNTDDNDLDETGEKIKVLLCGVACKLTIAENNYSFENTAANAAANTYIRVIANKFRMNMRFYPLEFPVMMQKCIQICAIRAKDSEKMTIIISASADSATNRANTKTKLAEYFIESAGDDREKLRGMIEVCLWAKYILPIFTRVNRVEIWSLPEVIAFIPEYCAKKIKQLHLMDISEDFDMRLVARFTAVENLALIATVPRVIPKNIAELQRLRTIYVDVSSIMSPAIAAMPTLRNVLIYRGNGLTFKEIYGIIGDTSRVRGIFTMNGTTSRVSLG